MSDEKLVGPKPNARAKGSGNHRRPEEIRPHARAFDDTKSIANGEVRQAKRIGRHGYSLASIAKGLVLSPTLIYRYARTLCRELGAVERKWERAWSG